VLPLALVSPWGRVFPKWLPLVSGRDVPRWLVIGPALVIGLGLTAYFGMTTVQLVVQTIAGTWAQGVDSLPLSFFWVSVPAYLVWGIGLTVAALVYLRATRPRCLVCGRGGPGHIWNRELTQSRERRKESAMKINLDDLIKDVSEKAGITMEQARTAVTTAFDQLKSKLPEPLVDHLEALFAQPESDEDRKKAALAGLAATTAAVNVVVLPHAR